MQFTLLVKPIIGWVKRRLKAEKTVSGKLRELKKRIWEIGGVMDVDGTLLYRKCIRQEGTGYPPGGGRVIQHHCQPTRMSLTTHLVVSGYGCVL